MFRGQAFRGQAFRDKVFFRDLHARGHPMRMFPLRANAGGRDLRGLMSPAFEVLRSPDCAADTGEPQRTGGKHSMALDVTHSLNKASAFPRRRYAQPVG